MRDRAYYRKMRAKHIQKKKAIYEQHWGDGFYPYDGMYSKGKVHCSCGMCMSKTRNKSPKRRGKAPSINFKHSDLIKIDKIKAQTEDYFLGNEDITDEYFLTPEEEIWACSTVG